MFSLHGGQKAELKKLVGRTVYIASDYGPSSMQTDALVHSATGALGALGLSDCPSQHKRKHTRGGRRQPTVHQKSRFVDGVGTY